MADSKTTAGPIFDPHDPVLHSNPQTVYELLRNESPLHRTTIGGRPVWVLSRHADVARVIGNPTTLMNPPESDTPPAFGDGPAAMLWRNALSMMDPPRHTHTRRVIGRPFAHRRMERLQPLVNSVTEDVFSSIDPGNLNVVNDLALKVPMRVICGLLGIPHGDWNDLQAWTDDFLRIFLPDISDEEEIQRVQTASQRFIDYFGAMIDERLRQPRDDLTSDFVKFVGQPEGMSRSSLIGALRGLLTAGFETTAATISAALLGFARQPGAFQELRENPDCVPNAVEELLRWETPVQVMVRYLGEDLHLGETLLRRGDAIWLLLGSANHDPRRYANPESIDVERACADHFAFGGGRHFCLGAYLAKLELQSVLQRLIKHYRNVELRCSTVVRRQNFQFRSIESLQVSLVP